LGHGSASPWSAPDAPPADGGQQQPAAHVRGRGAPRFGGAGAAVEGVLHGGACGHAAAAPGESLVWRHSPPAGVPWHLQQQQQQQAQRCGSMSRSPSPAGWRAGGAGPPPGSMQYGGGPGGVWQQQRRQHQPQPCCGAPPRAAGGARHPGSPGWRARSPSPGAGWRGAGRDRRMPPQQHTSAAPCRSCSPGVRGRPRSPPGRARRRSRSDSRALSGSRSCSRSRSREFWGRSRGRSFSRGRSPYSGSSYSRSRSRSRSCSRSRSRSRSRSWGRVRSRSLQRGRRCSSGARSRSRGRDRGGGGDGRSKAEIAAEYARVAELTRLAALQQAAMTPAALQASRHARRVYVGNLPHTITENGIKAFFNQVRACGSVVKQRQALGRQQRCTTQLSLRPDRTGAWACVRACVRARVCHVDMGHHPFTPSALWPRAGDDGGGGLQPAGPACRGLLPAAGQALWVCGVPLRGGGQQRNGL
jgi:hypothetical protein